MAKSPRWKKPVGSGSTQRIVTAVGSDMTFEEIGEALSFAASVATFERAVADIEQYCRVILADRGIDPEKESYSRKDENQQTAIYYACTILRYLSIIRDRIASDAPRSTKDVAEECARYGLRLGLTIREWQMKGLADRGWYASREDGRKMPAPGKGTRGRPAKAADETERNREMRAEYEKRRKTSRLSDSALMADIGRKQKPPLQKSQSIAIISKRT